MRNKGFTLIELLVVIAIIGVLSSLAVVSLNNARGKANDVKVQSNVTTASTNLELKRADGITIDAAIVSSTVDALGAPACQGSSWLANPDGNYDNVAIYAKFCSTQAGNHDIADVFCSDTSGFRGTTTAALAGAGTLGKCQE